MGVGGPKTALQAILGVFAKLEDFQYCLLIKADIDSMILRHHGPDINSWPAEFAILNSCVASGLSGPVLERAHTAAALRDILTHIIGEDHAGNNLWIQEQ